MTRQKIASDPGASLVGTVTLVAGSAVAAGAAVPAIEAPASSDRSRRPRRRSCRGAAPLPGGCVAPLPYDVRRRVLDSERRGDSGGEIGHESERHLGKGYARSSAPVALARARRASASGTPAVGRALQPAAIPSKQRVELRHRFPLRLRHRAAGEASASHYRRGVTVPVDLERLTPGAKVRLPDATEVVTLIAVMPGVFWSFYFDGPSGTGSTSCRKQSSTGWRSAIPRLSFASTSISAS